MMQHHSSLICEFHRKSLPLKIAFHRKSLPLKIAFHRKSLPLNPLQAFTGEASRGAKNKKDKKQERLKRKSAVDNFCFFANSPSPS